MSNYSYFSIFRLEHVAVQQEKLKKGKEFLFKERVLQSLYLKNYQTITPSVSIETFVNKIQERTDKKLINRETGLEDDSRFYIFIY